jgi:cupin 2 domain-containing protein
VTDPRRGNLGAGLPDVLADEFCQTLLRRPGCRIERIVSRGHASPPGFWYDQEEGEWVVLLQGRAVLRLAEEDRRLELGPGDYVDLPPHCRHRVESTDPDGDTVWLAVFY